MAATMQKMVKGSKVELLTIWPAQLASRAPLLAAEKRLIIFFLRARHDPVSDLWLRG